MRTSGHTAQLCVKFCLHSKANILSFLKLWAFINLHVLLWQRRSDTKDIRIQELLNGNRRILCKLHRFKSKPRKIRLYLVSNVRVLDWEHGLRFHSKLQVSRELGHQVRCNLRYKSLHSDWLQKLAFWLATKNCILSGYKSLYFDWLQKLVF